MFGADEVEQLRARIVLFDDAIADIRPVEARHENARVVERETVHDLVARNGVGRCGERDARHVRKAFVQHRQLDIFWPEIMPPLRHAVRLVDREEADARAFEQIEKARRHETLGRDVEQVDVAFAQGAFGGGGLGAGERRIEIRGAHADFGERGHLVLHQRDEGRDDDARAEAGFVAHERGNLIAKRFTAAGGHQHQRIAARCDMLHDLGLLPSKCGITEDFVEDFERAGHEERDRGGSRRGQWSGFYQPGRPLPAAAANVGRSADETRARSATRHGARTKPDKRESA
jgi:hypothetical protein